MCEHGANVDLMLNDAHFSITSWCDMSFAALTVCLLCETRTLPILPLQISI